MAERFETLLKECRRRRRKAWAKRLGLLAGAVAVVLAGAAYMQRSARAPAAVATKAGPAVPETPRPAPKPPAAKKSEPPSAAEKPALVPSIATTADKAAVAVEKEELIDLKKERSVQKRPKPLPVAKVPAPVSGPKSVTVPPEAREAPKKSPSPKKTILFQAEEKAEKRPKPVAPILEVKDVTDLDALVKQFEKYPRYATALKIARIHFDKGEYEAAALWARKANLLDRDDEEAWILYARSEYALGRKERAKRILALYLDYKDSARAKTLLMGWSKQ